MWTYRLLVGIAGLCSIAMLADGQTNDWRSVENLAPGTTISVVKRTRLDCDLVNVTDSELTCDHSIAGDMRRYVFKREQVREVRLEMPQHNQWVKGAAVGAAIGGLLGFLGGRQLADPEARAYAGFYGIPIGAFVGGFIGHGIHRHGAIVYRQR